MSRTFTIEAIFNQSGNKIRFEGGRYVSTSPSGAARKAFSQAYRYLGAKGKTSLEVHIRESTQGSSHKIYQYIVKRVAERSERIIYGVKIVNHFTTKIKAV